MLRSLVSASERLYTCLVIPRKLPLLQKGPCIFGCDQGFHSSQLRADRPIDRSSLRQMEPDKLPAAEDAAVSTEEAKPGSLYPTADTHSMLIGGVRFDELPIIHIKATRNNTIVSVTKHSGDVLARSSGGMEGFKNARKGTNIAAQAAGISAGQKALGKDMNTVRVCVRGLGPGRLPALRGLQMAGVNIVSITDTTRIQQHGPRPRKQRRL